MVRSGEKLQVATQSRLDARLLATACCCSLLLGGTTAGPSAATPTWEVRIRHTRYNTADGRNREGTLRSNMRPELLVSLTSRATPSLPDSAAALTCRARLHQ